MSHAESGHAADDNPAREDLAPGDEGRGRDIRAGLIGYGAGFVLAAGLTAVSFYVAHAGWIWRPGVPAGLIVLAVAQMGVHLVFFLHITTAPDSTNNVLALAFGVLIVLLVVVGSIWIMHHLNHNMMTMDQMMRMQH
jgi:cytochrome o ubiquinol oxidase operon protein cyoD